ncbi:MAG: hypothetical protein Alis3KO_41130 [Aliiglaciecola sp.]
MVTYYNLVPNIAFAIVLLLLSDVGLSDRFKYGAFIFIVVTSLIHVFSSLFEPWFSELEFRDGHIIYTTSFGGTVDVDLSMLDPEKGSVSKGSFFLVDLDGNSVDISTKLYSKSDVVKVMECLIEYVDS